MEEYKLEQEIEDYLLEKMNFKEKENFENIIKNDSELQKTIETQKEVIQGMKAYRRREKLSAFMKDVHNDYEESLQEETEAKRIPINSKRNWLRPIFLSLIHI